VTVQRTAVTAAPTMGAAAPAVPDPANDHTALWAEQQIATLGVNASPEYGSPAWLALRANDPRRAAAIIEAAEKWRRQQAREQWLDELLERDPEQWYRHVTADANTEAKRVVRAERLSTRPTAVELARRRTYGEPRPVVATPGWTPVAIPGRPGWWRHCLGDGRQLDLPHNRQESTA
jgi:hypothetical protein